jgi:hypothetical protein
MSSNPRVGKTEHFFAHIGKSDLLYFIKIEKNALQNEKTAHFFLK